MLQLLGMVVPVVENSAEGFRITFSHLFCTLISENQPFDISRSVSNLIKISVPVHLNFFSVHLNFINDIFSSIGLDIWLLKRLHFWQI